MIEIALPKFSRNSLASELTQTLCGPKFTVALAGQKVP